ncbi:MAG: LuxR C-terminal-related transcriptional regulator [Tepidiformaceae bacterium]
MSDGVRFCTTPDGLQLGYSTFGTGRPLLIVPSWWMSPEADRKRLTGRDFWNDLPAGSRTIAYDRRGIGVSTREVSDVSLERQVDDLRALVEQLKLSSFDLWCFGDAAPIGVTYTVRFPEKPARLILYNPWSLNGSEARQRAAAMAPLIRADWGLASRAFAQMLYPKGPLDAQESSTKAIRETQSPETAQRYLDYCTSFDMREELEQLALPVLVISRQGPGREPLIPEESCRLVASTIPGARYVAFESSKAMCPYYDYREYHGAVCQFLADSGREMPLHTSLSRREVEVLGLVANGKTNAEIASLLVISRFTVDRHVSNILAKTGCANRAEASLYAARHSLIG